MHARPTINDLAKAAGVSVATVDRVLNQRAPVREDTADRVLRAAESIGFHAISLLKQRLKADVPPFTFGFVLQKRADIFYQMLAADLSKAGRECREVRGKTIIEFIDELSPAAIAERLRDVGARADAVGVVSIDHPHVWGAVQALRDRGVPTVTLLSDINAEARAGYVGRDNRKEGRTAAWMIHRAATRPGKVGIIVGSHRYLCQETAEISFRSYYRELAPEFRLLEPLLNLEDSRIAREATLDLIAGNHDLVGLYVCGGGVDGVIEAAREEKVHSPVAIVCNELTPGSKAALIDGVLTAVIATPTALLARRCVEEMVRSAAEPPGQPRQIVVPFDLYISENI